MICDICRKLIEETIAGGTTKTKGHYSILFLNAVVCVECFQRQNGNLNLIAADIDAAKKEAEICSGHA